MCYLSEINRFAVACPSNFEEIKSLKPDALTMNFTLLGWNFRSTPLEIRDRLSLTEQEQLELVQQINARCGIQESVLLSTCNRTELYLSLIHI